MSKQHEKNNDQEVSSMNSDSAAPKKAMGMENFLKEKAGEKKTETKKEEESSVEETVGSATSEETAI